MVTLAKTVHPFRRHYRLWAASLIFGGVWPVALKIPQPTMLPLDLVGIVSNEFMPKQFLCIIRWTSSAIIEDVFQEGERAFSLAEIRAIGRAGVIIQNLITKKLEYLGFHKGKPHGSPRKPPVPSVVADSPDSLHVIIPEETVEYYLNNLRDLLDSAYVSPRYAPDVVGRRLVSGFEISRIKKDGIIGNLGLRDGDVILEANGCALDSLPTVLRLAGEVQNVRRVKLTVLRAGKIVHFIFDRK